MIITCAYCGQPWPGYCHCGRERRVWLTITALLVAAFIVAALSGCPKKAPHAGTPQTNLPMVCNDASVAEGSTMSKCSGSKQYFVAASDSSLVRMCANPPTDCNYNGFRWTQFRNVTSAQKVEVCTLPKLSGDAANGSGCNADNAANSWSGMQAVSKDQVTRAGGVPPVTGTFTVEPTEGQSPLDVTLTWNVPNLAGTAPCTASGGWSGAKPASGTELISGVSVTTAYTLTCAATNSNAVLLHWTNPTTNTDGTPLTNRTGSLVAWGDTMQDGAPVLDKTKTVGASAAESLIDNLAAKTWYFGVVALANQQHSDYSNIVSYNVLPPGTGGTFEQTRTVTVHAGPSPPSDLTASAPQAYRLNTGINTLSIEQVGVVPLGTPCDEQQTAMGKYVIARESITPAPGQALPDVVLATCVKGTWHAKQQQ